MYIREAHAADSDWPIPIPGEDAVNAPKTAGERASIARKCMIRLKIDIPCLLDDMDNSAVEQYQSWPDRIFLVDVDGKIAVRAQRGPWGFKPGVEKVMAWLKERFPDVDPPKTVGDAGGKPLTP